ncbi:hypothetical protein HK097_001307 [Rhizophlyctis rosea]|uniref:Uncharacterized protein n=1 Tax=Rhizophlyctis rosea TaxID=64517 RepID=A0AAD5S4I0_9FUNG|nr:hypothetical protein HK097_001307 [Rhizophlyctis rosea]
MEPRNLARPAAARVNRRHQDLAPRQNTDYCPLKILRVDGLNARYNPHTFARGITAVLNDENPTASRIRVHPLLGSRTWFIICKQPGVVFEFPDDFELSYGKDDKKIMVGKSFISGVTKLSPLRSATSPSSSQKTKKKKEMKEKGEAVDPPAQQPQQPAVPPRTLATDHKYLPVLNTILLISLIVIIGALTYRVKAFGEDLDAVKKLVGA